MTESASPSIFVAPRTPRLGIGQIARQLVHTGDTAWNWRVEIASKPYREAEAASVVVDRDGVAEVSLDMPADLTRFGGADCRVFCGYGDHLVEYFTGKLDKPHWDRNVRRTKVKAYGVNGMLARRSFDTGKRYQGMTFWGFFGDLQGRLDPRARIVVKQGDMIAMEDTDFNGEVALAEAVESVIRPANYVAVDRPHWNLAVLPRPRPGAGVRSKATYNSNQLAPGQPDLKPAPGGPYYKVVVFRRDEAGVEVVRAEAKIANRGPYRPDENEIWFIPEFQGTQSEGQTVAYLTARIAEIEAYEGSVQDVSANPELYLFDQVSFVLIDDRTMKRYPTEDTYAALITSLELNLVGGIMGFDFEALRESSRQIIELEPFAPLSPYVIPSTIALADWEEDEVGLFARLDRQEDYWGEDINGLWIDPTLADPEDEAGQSAEEGLWVIVDGA
jgi:hypothetical protein